MHSFIFRLSLALGIITAFSLCNMKTVKYLNATAIYQQELKKTLPDTTKIKNHRILHGIALGMKKILKLATNPKFLAIAIPSLVILGELYHKYTGKENPSTYLLKKIWSNLYKKPMAEIDAQHKLYAECLNNSYHLGKNGSECNSIDLINLIEKIGEQKPQLLRQELCLKDNLLRLDNSYECNTITTSDLITLHQLAINADTANKINADANIGISPRISQGLRSLGFKAIEPIVTETIKSIWKSIIS